MIQSKLTSLREQDCASTTKVQEVLVRVLSIQQSVFIDLMDMDAAVLPSVATLKPS